MKTYIIYNTKTATYIVPKEQYKQPKNVISVFEIDAPREVVLCDKKIKLKARIENLNQVEKLINCLKVSVPELM